MRRRRHRLPHLQNLAKRESESARYRDCDVTQGPGVTGTGTVDRPCQPWPECHGATWAAAARDLAAAAATAGDCGTVTVARRR